MGNFSKWIGGGLGWVLGGTLGALAGFVVGSIIDKQRESGVEGTQTSGGRTTPGGFVK